MDFRPIDLSDREAVMESVAASGTLICEASFANMFMWRNVYKLGIAFDSGFFFRCGVGADRFCYRFPLGGGDLEKALRNIAEDAGKHGALPSFVGITEEQKAALSALLPEISFEFEEKPEWADYIYKTADLARLSGKKYHSKRNFINRFAQSYASRSESGPITPADHEELMAFTEKWCRENGCLYNKDLSLEACSIRNAFRHYDELGLFGLWLRVDGKIAAYTFASDINGLCADVHAEKAEADVDGAYAVINNLLARSCEDRFELLNREEDLGIPGLRRAKQSYNPVILLMRYNAWPKPL